MAKQTTETEEEWLWRVTEDLRRALGDEASIDDDLANLAEKASYRITELEDEFTPARGAEAEELRRGVEDLLSGASAPTTAAEEYFHEGLRELLDNVDARDSLKWLEDHDKMVEVIVRTAGQLDTAGRIPRLISYQAAKDLCDLAEKIRSKKA